MAVRPDWLVLPASFCQGILTCTRSWLPEWVPGLGLGRSHPLESLMVSNGLLNPNKQMFASQAVFLFIKMLRQPGQKMFLFSHHQQSFRFHKT